MVGLKSRHHASNVHEIDKILSSMYLTPRHHNKSNPLNELLFIICSLRTSEKLYLESYSRLMKLCPKFKDFTNISNSDLVSIFKYSGLAEQKAKIIQSCIPLIKAQFGRITLSPLQKMSEIECEKFLTSLPGIGLKTARCVLLYSLNMRVFPVDSHCWRISHRIGWVRNTTSDNQPRIKEMNRLQKKIPPALRYSLHVNMVAFGRDICTAKKPKCRSCPIFQFCKKIGIKKDNKLRKLKN
jgi:endonuclease III